MESEPLRNRNPAVAGTFYPAGRENLLVTIEGLFSAAIDNRHLHDIKALIVPHAGYVYSGSVAASGYKQIDRTITYENVFLIGSSHHVSFNGASIYTEGNFITPLGVARVNIELARELVSGYPDVFNNNSEAHIHEHSLEVQIPFLQYLYSEKLQIVPIIIATQNTGTVEKIARALESYFKGNNLFIISTDFSHYPDYENAYTTDSLTAKAIIENSASGFLSVISENAGKKIPNLATSICGWTSALVLLYITEHSSGTSYHEVVYKNSGDMGKGDKHRVVGYHAIAVTTAPVEENIITTEEYLSDHEEKDLLRLARYTITNYLETGRIADANGIADIKGRVVDPAGAFVTLIKEGKLRGCIGQFNADRPLYRVIQEAAVSAATRDYRFPSVKKDELEGIEIEISVLTPMRRINSIDEIIPGKHGIYIKKGHSSGTFLPQVARQVPWNVEELVSHCSRDKAGIGWDGWRDAELYVYEAYVFREMPNFDPIVQNNE